MTSKSFFSRIYHLLIYPRQAWEEIKNENLTDRETLKKYVLPIIVFLGFCSFAGTYYSLKDERVYESLISVLLDCTAAFLCLYVTAFLIKKINDKYISGTSLSASRVLCFYSSIPSFIGVAISKLHPSLVIFGLVGLCSIYIFWVGSESLINLPKEKKVGTGFIFEILLMIIFYLVKLFLTLIISIIYY